MQEIKHTIPSQPNADPRIAGTLAERLRRRAAGVTRHRRTFWVTAPATEHAPLAERAIRWLLPWNRAAYPGIGPGARDLLGSIVSTQAIRSWRAGRNRLPADIARQLAAVIRSRAVSGLALADELEAHAAQREAEPKVLRGVAAMHAARNARSQPRGRGDFRESHVAADGSVHG